MRKEIKRQTDRQRQGEESVRKGAINLKKKEWHETVMLKRV